MNTKINKDFDVAVLDGPTVGWVISAMNDKTEIMDFFDIAAIIEALVLHNRVQLMFPSKLTEMEHEFYNVAKEALSPLIFAGIVDFVSYDDPEPSSKIIDAIDKKKTTKKKSTKRKSSTKTLDADNDFTAWYILQSVRFVLAERMSNGNAIVLPRQTAFYNMNRRVRAEHSICNLYLNYKSIRELAQFARQASLGGEITLDKLSAYWQLPIPPLCLDALGRCNTLNKVWTVTGDLWEEYSKIRRLHNEIGIIHGDRDSSPAVRERNAKKLREEWYRLELKWRARIDSFKMADTTTNLRQEAGLLGDMTGLSLSVGGDIALDPTAPLKWAQLIHTLYKRMTGYWRLRKIHDSMESYWKINDFELYHHFERLTKRPVTSEDHNVLVKTELQERDYPNKVVIVDFFPD